MSFGPDLRAVLRNSMKRKSGVKTSRAAKRQKDAAAGNALVRRATSATLRAAVKDDVKAEIRRLKTQLAKATARIEELQAAAETDFLLEIPNRRGFERELARAISYIQRYHAAGALIVLDVDRLKPVNDQFGHAAGDEVLKAIVAVLSRQIRSSDVIGRLGGDEFALLLWNLSETDAHAKAAALEADVDGLSFAFEGSTVGTGVSAGVVLLGPHSEAGRALADADRAMYVRKAQRRHEAQPLASTSRTAS
ncbi:diguanylate cyclase (GGDEF) domain-containing protein [Bradyrhizobium erythrophlei]|jgi:diguanylate cyclase (GGDEF)-like protein|uniref:diguanylate cyclase n=2 Tax=Bradyrhizobium erythrophlei TaxID=1437360 RepID=A0A1M7TGX7_9BRAD|nr:diguanylate cyclase (GGDEF) domain-containing protein [Bradyrhizobium erythrophlei]